MKRLIALLVILMMVMPVIGVAAQEDVVLARLEEYNANLPQGYGLLTVEDLNVMLAEKAVTLLDVREAEEYAAGHLEESFNVPLRTIAQNLNLLPDLDAPIVVVCKGGSRAALAMTALQLLGYTNVTVLKGGYDAWVGEELPTTTDAYTVEAGTAPDVDAAVLAAVDSYLSNIPQGFALVKPTDLAAELVEGGVTVIDVRSAEEWGKGYIEGAQHLWINEFMSRRDEWPQDKDAKIVVYCGIGQRGGIVAVMLTLMGYTNVRNMSGGITAWNAAELPLVGAEAAAPAELDLAKVIGDYVAALPASFNAVRAADLSAELASDNKPFLVDVRTSDEYAEGHIADAINVPLSDLAANLNLLPAQDANLVIVCGSGHRSALAMTALNLLGYSSTRSLISGVGGWKAAELPLVTDPVEATAGAAPTVDPALFEKVSAFLNSIPAGYWTVKAPDLSAELVDNPPVVLDVRTDGEWAEGRIEGAIHMPLRDMVARQADWPQDKAASIVIYDNPTHRSSMAMAFLRMLGYENVRVLGGGVGAWKGAELPLVTD